MKMKTGNDNDDDNIGGCLLGGDTFSERTNITRRKEPYDADQG